MRGCYCYSNCQYTIGPQDCDALKIVMRSIYLQHSANQPTDVTSQIRELNNNVIQIE